MPSEKPIDELFIEISAKQTNANKQISAMATSLEKLAGTLDKLSSLSTVAKDIKSLVEPIEKSKGSTNQLKSLADGLRSLGKIDGIQNTISNIRAIYNEIAKFSQLPSEVQSTISSLGALATNAKAAKDAVSGVSGSSTASDAASNTPATADNTGEIEATSKTIGDVVDGIKGKISSLTAFMSQVSSNTLSQNFTAAFDTIKNSVEKTKTKFSEFKTSLSTNIAQGAESAKTKFKELPATINTAIKGVSFAGLGAAAANVGSVMMKPLTAAGGLIKKALSEPIKKAAKSLKDLKFSDITKAVKKFGSAATKAFKNAVGFVKKMGSAFGGLVKKIVPGAEHLEKFNGVFKKLFSRIVTMGLLRRAFSSMIKAMQEGIGNVAKSVDSYNKSMSTLATSGNYVKNALAASIAPALAAIAPIVDQLADKFVKLTEIFSQVLAKITGAKTFVKAKKTQVDYAESLDSSAASANKAKKSTEAYKKTLAGFDQINQLASPDKDKDSSSSKKGSSGGGFEEVSVADTGVVGKIGKMIDDIKAKLKDGDFYGAGKVLATSLNKVIKDLNNLDWNGVQEKVKSWASNIGAAINGFIENVDWSNVGVLLGNVLNTALDFVNTLEHSINWDALGQAFGNGINGLLSKLDPTAVGQKLTGELRLIVQTVHGFVTTLDFAQVGSFIAQALMSAIDNVPWETFGSNISDGISGIFNTLTSLLTTKSDSTGKDLATTFGDGINAIFKGFDANKVKKSLVKAINAIFKSLKTLFDTINWEEIGGDVGTILSSIFEIDWNGIGKTLSSAVHGIFNLLKGVFKKFNWKAVGKAVADLIKGIDFEQLLGDIGSTLSVLLTGLLDTISSFFQNFDFAELIVDLINGIVAFIKGLDIENIVHTLVEVIDSIFDALVSIDWLSIINTLVSAVFEIIKSIDWLGLINDILYLFVSYFEHAIDGTTNLLNIGVNLITELFNGISDFMKNVGTWLTENVFKPIGDWFSKQKNKFKSWGKNLIQNIKSGVGNVWSKIKDKFTAFFTGIKDWFNKKKADFKSKGSDLIENIKSGVGNVWSKIKDKFTKFFTSLSSWFSNKVTKFKGFGNKIVTGIRDGIGTVWDKIKKKFTDLATDAKNWFSGKGKKKNPFTGLGSGIIDGLKDGLGTVWKKVSGVFSTFRRNMIDWFSKENQFTSLGKKIITGLTSGIRNNWTDVINTIKSKLSNLGENIKDWLGIGSSSSSGSGKKPKGHATGGIPKSGEMFYARENGIPEMVGRFGNKTGVANNQQIVAGISEGVYSAVVSALSGQRATGGGDRNINLNVDGRTLESIVYNENQKKLRRRSAFG